MKTKILHAALFTPMGDGFWGLPLLLKGPPGTAKSATVKAIAKDYGFHAEVLSPGERGEGAFGVTPVPTTNAAGRTILGYPAPEWVEALRQPDGSEAGIVFLDEINTAPPALQPALLGAIQERRIGGHQFGPRVRVIGAMNPVGQAAGGWDLAPPVANRTGHIEWPAPDVADWATFIIGGAESNTASDPKAEETRVLEAWPTAFAKASGQITSFLRRRPELLHKMPADGDPAQSAAWPSPRTWEYAIRAKASADVHGLSEVDTDELIAAFIGQAAAGEFASWVANADLPDPAEILDGTVEFKPDPERLDRTEAVLSSCAALVAPTKAAKRDARAKALWAILDKSMSDAKDITIPAVTALIGAKLAGSAEARPIMAKLHGVLAAAGAMNKGK